MNPEKTLRFAFSILLGLQPLLFSAAKAFALDDNSTAAQARLNETAEKTQAALGASTSEGMSQGLSNAMDGSRERGGAVLAGHGRGHRGRRGRLDRERAAEEQRSSDPGRIQALSAKPEPPKGSAVRDTSKEENSDKESKLLTNLKKDAVGGLYGAAGFGILGLIFGGPAGAIMGAMIGFALMAAVIHLNNNL